MVRTPTSTLCSTLGSISLVLLAGACDNCDCDDHGLPQRWVFVNESSTDFTLSWFCDDEDYGTPGRPISSLVRAGDVYEVDAYGRVDITTVYATDTCVRDIQLSSCLTLTTCESTTYIIAPWKLRQPEGELPHSYVAPWFLHNRQESADCGQQLWTWHLTDAALDSLAAQATRAGLPPTHDTDDNGTEELP